MRKQKNSSLSFPLSLITQLVLRAADTLTSASDRARTGRPAPKLTGGSTNVLVPAVRRYRAAVGAVRAAGQVAAMRAAAAAGVGLSLIHI